MITRATDTGTAAILIVAGVIAQRFVGTGFLPEMDEGAFVLDYFTPGGTALAETDREIHIVERILAETPEVAGTSRRTGAELGLFATEQNTGDIVARLKPPGQRSRSIFEIIDEVRVKVETAVPRLRIEFVQILSDVINDLAGSARPVEIKLYGPDLNRLEDYARSIEPKIAAVPGVEDLYNGVSEPSAELEIRAPVDKRPDAGHGSQRVETSAGWSSARGGLLSLGYRLGRAGGRSSSRGSIDRRSRQSARLCALQSDGARRAADRLVANGSTGAAWHTGNVRARRNACRAFAREPTANDRYDVGRERSFVGVSDQ